MGFIHSSFHSLYIHSYPYVISLFVPIQWHFPSLGSLTGLTHENFPGWMLICGPSDASSHITLPKCHEKAPCFVPRYGFRMFLGRKSNI